MPAARDSADRPTYRGVMVTVVTGAAGHVGVNLVRALLDEDRDVRVVDIIDPRPLVGPGVDWVKADVRDEDAMRAALTGASTVFHLAAVISVAGSRGGLVESVNVGGVRATSRGALRAGVSRFVHCSSVHAFDLMACRDRVVDERSPRATDPGLPIYDRSKAAGERMLGEAVRDGLPAVIVNPSGIIGPIDVGPSRMAEVLRAAARGRLPATVTGSFDWVDVRDVVSALLAAESRGAVGENHLLGGRSATLSELAALACDATGARRPLADLPLWFAKIWSPAATSLASRSRNPLLYTFDSLHALESRPRIDHSKATATLGFHPRPLEQTVSDLITAESLVRAPAR